MSSSPTSSPAARRSALPTCAVVLAGGTGTRVGLGLPKQLIKVAGKSIIEHTLDALQASDVIDEIHIVMSTAWIDTLRDLLGRRYPKLGSVLPGGSTRNDSTRAALAALGDRECKVLFHDAVRPFVDDRILRDCVTALDFHDAVDVVIESADTIVEVGEDEALVGIPDRSRLRRGQTPQGFLLSTIREAYALADAAGFTSATDDCSVVLRFLPETPITAVNGSEENIKITRPLDLIIADRLFQLASRSLSGEQAGAPAGSLDGKTIVIFGGSYGIGYAVARGAEALGATVLSFSRSDTQTDIRDPEGVTDALAKAAAATGGVDAVIISAATLTKGRADGVDRCQRHRAARDQPARPGADREGGRALPAPQRRPPGLLHVELLHPRAGGVQPLLGGESRDRQPHPGAGRRVVTSRRQGQLHQSRAHRDPDAA